MTAPSQRVPFGVGVVLLVLALVFHTRLIAWLTGDEPHAAATHHEAPAADVAYYTCAMHTSVHAHAPGSCPICGMALHAVSLADAQTGVVQIDAARRTQIGIATERATTAALAIDVHAVGKLAHDERALHDVVLKFGGYLSDLRITALGQPVHQGDPLFQIYSPEIFAGAQDVLLARQSRDAIGNGDALVRAAETRLALLGLSRDQIDQIGPAALDKLTVRSPATGYVIEKNVVEGAAVKAGERVFRIAGLDEVWVEADLFEADLARITQGAAATVAIGALPGKTFAGKVSFVYPYLDPSTRTGRVRIALANPGRELKPDMYADVTFHVALGSRLQVPTSALVYTGARTLVLVDLGDGRIAPRDVQIGARDRDRAEVLAGLADGDAVVTAGNFLVAAESRIRSSGTFWTEPR